MIYKLDKGVEEYINEKWNKLRKDKDRFIGLEDYTSSTTRKFRQ